MRSAGNVPTLTKCITALLNCCLGRSLWMGHTQKEITEGQMDGFPHAVMKLPRNLKFHKSIEIKRNARIS